MGDIELKNRIVMAALTRGRADLVDAIPNDLHVEYYSARAGAGLILTECSHVSPLGRHWVGSTGIHTDAQVEGWKRVTKAVHEKGSKIII